MPTRVPVRDTITRHWSMLATIPAGTWIDTPTIRERLEALGYDVTSRQVQMDLARYLEPGSAFPLRCNSKSKPYQYQWKVGARLLSVPAMDVQAAVTFDLVRRYLEPLLPAATLEHLQPYFREAERRLREASGGAQRLARWPTKVLVLQDGPPLRARRVDPSVQRIVHEALLSEQCLEVEYQPRMRSGQTYLLAPLGIIYQGSTQALVSTKLDAAFAATGEPRTFLLHRMRKAKRIAHARPMPRDFGLAAFAASGRYAFRLGEPITLRALVNADAVAPLEEAGVSDDQRLTRQRDGRFLLEATVAHTYALRVWILGFAEGMEVLAPTELRDEIARKLTEAAARYRSQRSVKR